MQRGARRRRRGQARASPVCCRAARLWRFLVFPVLWCLPGLLVWVGPLASQSLSPLPEPHLPFTQIQDRMRQHLRELANCTCEQTIRQYHRSWWALPLSIPLQRFSRVRLQVAYVEGHEWWAQREEEPFTEADLHAWARHGAVANGGFALLADEVFSSRGPVFRYHGEERLHGRPMLRYDFRMPPLTSRWVLEVGGQQARVGYHGSFWAEEGSGDVVRLEIEADEIPSRLGLDRFVRRIEYGWRSVGGSALYLPQSADLRVVRAPQGPQGRGAGLYQTRSEWSQCRRYRATATVHFDEPASGQHRPERSSP